MEGYDGDPVLAGGDRMPLDPSQHLDLGAVLVDPRRLDEHRPHRPALDSADVEVGLERAHLAPERVAAGADVDQVQVIAVEYDQPGAGAKDRRPGANQVADGLRQPLALDAA